MTVLEYLDEIIVVDAGLTFPTEDMPGVDLVIPDITYLEQNAHKVKGIVLTHGHEDHIGAIPFVLKKLPGVPVYGLTVTLAMLTHKFKEHQVEDAKLNTVAYKQVVKIGKHFTCEWVKICHSIMDSACLSINTPIGTVFCSGDYKIDFTPVDGEGGDLTRIAEIGAKGVLLYMGESTNAERPGYAMSESTVGVEFDKIFKSNVGKRIIVATFSSNIHRIQQILNVSAKYGRSVAFSGRSMINVLDVASKIGAMDISKNKIIDIEKISNITDDKLTIITTGSQGEPMSALTRMASGDFKKVELGENDVIIISASPIPGNEKSVYRVINNLYRKGASVVYDAISDIHVSGHACQEELKLMFALLKPRYFIPVHGEYRHLKIHGDLAESMGIPRERIQLCDVGDVIELTKTNMKKRGSVPSGHILVDGAGIGDVGSVVLRDRKLLSEDGLVIVVLGIDTDEGEVTTGPDIISRGFVYMKESEELLAECKEVVLHAISYLDLKATHDFNLIKNNIRKYLKNFLYKKTKRNPMILTIVVDN
ncbi:MAG: ribonuclease J [Firmicutes bacterium]|nr:ribonuclease J [Bacillota bacterium]